MDIDPELIKRLPHSFQIWNTIEEEAQRRAEERFAEIMQKEATGASTPAATHKQALIGAQPP